MNRDHIWLIDNNIQMMKIKLKNLLIIIMVADLLMVDSLAVD